MRALGLGVAGFVGALVFAGLVPAVASAAPIGDLANGTARHSVHVGTSKPPPAPASTDDDLDPGYPYGWFHGGGFYGDDDYYGDDYYGDDYDDYDDYYGDCDCY